MFSSCSGAVTSRNRLTGIASNPKNRRRPCPPPQGTVFRANGVVRWLYTRDELYIMRRRNERRAVNPSDRAKDKNKTLVYTHNVCSVKGEDRFRLRAGQSERARAFKSFRSSCRTALFLPIVLLYCSARSYITAYKKKPLCISCFYLSSAHKQWTRRTQTGDFYFENKYYRDNNCVIFSCTADTLPCTTRPYRK